MSNHLQDFWKDYKSVLRQEYWSEPKQLYNEYWLGQHNGLGLKNKFQNKPLNTKDFSWNHFGGKERYNANNINDVYKTKFPKASRHSLNRASNIYKRRASNKIAQQAMKGFGLVSVAGDIAQPFIRVGMGQEVDDAIVGSAGDIGGSIGGMMLGAKLGTIVAPGAGTFIGGLAGSVIGGIAGGDGANWLWGKATGDDTWGGWRQSPKNKQSDKQDMYWNSFYH